MNDQEKTNPGEENRVHVGVLWSENTTETMLVEFRTTLLHQLADAVIKESVWEQFPNAETSFLVHCAAREYGEFLLSASESLGHFLGKDGMNFLDGVHLVYNQLLLRDGDLMPKGVHNGFLNQLHTSAHSQGQILQPRAYGLVEATPSEIKQTNACKTLKGFHTFVRNIDSA
ncbi:MAG: hypothetical protein HY961_01795 [Ignavibacteriae bacterium]|nr:hypothetical protein [Ignavibacteriota bacterium]